VDARTAFGRPDWAFALLRLGDGPAPESIQDESGEHRQAVAYLASHPELAGKYVAARKEGEAGGPRDPSYTVEVCDAATTMERPACEPKTNCAFDQRVLQRRPLDARIWI